ncbi:hypothetical protein BS17DRAFT_780238 [Gyrodon lividus]|nr:hypothetical protein BS17DRAFT_780238 [Gyrodon lividus]
MSTCALSVLLGHRQATCPCDFLHSKTLVISPRLCLLNTSLEFNAKVQRIHAVWTSWKRTSFSKIGILALGIS